MSGIAFEISEITLVNVMTPCQDITCVILTCRNCILDIKKKFMMSVMLEQDRYK